MNEEANLPERCATGIPGLDRILRGGLLSGGVYVVMGPPGSGKTICGNQICFHHAKSGGSAVFVTLLAESHTRMIGHLRAMSFFDPAAIPDRVYYVSAFKVLEAEGLQSLFTHLRKVIQSRRATVLVLDGLTSAEGCAPSPKEYKKFIHELQTITAMTKCTVLLLSGVDPERIDDTDYTLVDGIIEFTDELAALRSLRHVRVRKMRGTDQIPGRHTLEITSDGIVVHPRFESVARAGPMRTAVSESERLGFGIAALDRMLAGGVRSSSTTMLLGPSGAGKTILGLQFLAAGVERNEPGLYFGFYEPPQALLAKSRRINLALDEAAQDGRLEILWQQPVEGFIDILGERLLAAIRRRKVKRLFIDGMHGFQIAVDSPDRIRDLFGALANELECEAVTSLYSLETNDLFSSDIDVPAGGFSALTHNILLLRYVEWKARLHRLLSVVKLRDSHYDPAIREFKITEHGIDVEDAFESAENILRGTAHASSVERRITRVTRSKKGGRSKKRER